MVAAGPMAALASESMRWRWPWEERPHALCGLLDMLRISGSALIGICRQLGDAKHALLREDLVGNADTVLGDLAAAARNLQRAFQENVGEGIRGVHGGSLAGKPW